MTGVGHRCIRRGATRVFHLICLFMWKMGGKWDPQRKCVGNLQGNGGQFDCGWGFKTFPEKCKGHQKNLEPGQGHHIGSGWASFTVSVGQGKEVNIGIVGYIRQRGRGFRKS